MSQNQEIYNIKDVVVNVNNRKKRNVYIPKNIIQKVNLYTLYLDTIFEFCRVFDNDTGFYIQNTILKHINKSITNEIST